MELLQLWYFREIAHSGHLSRTAEKLHIAQPSLSQMLKRLENELGISLFDRIGKRLVLNENGVIFLKYTDQIFSALNNAKLELAEHTEKKKTSDIVRILSFAFASGNRKTNSESRSSYPSAYRERSEGCRGGAPDAAVVFDSKIFAKDQSEKRRRNKADSDERTDPSVASKVPSTYGERNASCGGLKGGAVH